MFLLPLPAFLTLQWSDGDLWRVGVSLPGDTLVSFKYIELGKNDQLVAWCSEVPDGTNMTVTVSRSDELISGYKVEVLQGECRQRRAMDQHRCAIYSKLQPFQLLLCLNTQA